MIRALLPAFALATLWSPVPDAEACSLPEGIYLEEDLAAGLTGVPTGGVVPIYAAVFEPSIYTEPTMTVVDPGGAPVAGALELTERRVIWRADAALAPQTIYTAQLIIDGWRTIDFTFETAADDRVPELVFGAGEVQLEESARPASRICCDTAAVDSCTNEPWQECWIQSVDHVPWMSARFTVSPDVARYYAFSAELPGATQAYGVVRVDGGGYLSGSFAEPRAEYCATARARPLVGGTDVLYTACQDHAALIEAEPFVPQEPDYSVCVDAPVDPETGEEVDTENGCAAGGDGAAWWLIGGLLLALRPSRAGARRRG